MQEDDTRAATGLAVQASRPRKVVLAGASGFIGRQLIARLSAGTDPWPIIGLTRNAESAAQRHAELDVEWRSCDLFSLSDAEAGLTGATHAYYLVHSMAPSARLNQASFADLDLILADNFARAAARAGVEQIIYLGGIVPEGPLSPHLRSRLEVEAQLGAHGVPVTALRAGLVLGQQGSSFQILRKLVERLPVMALPAWTRTPTSPVGLDDCVELLARCLGDRASYGRHGDIGCSESLTYESMIRSTADGLGLRRAFVRIPLLSPGLSRAWVSMITGAPRELVAPLVASLECEMVARDLELQRHLGLETQGFSTALAQALSPRRSRGGHEPPPPSARQRRRRRHRPAKDVRSVQRLANPDRRSMRWVAREYARWLPRFMWPLIEVEADEAEGKIEFRLAFVRRPLLELALQSDRSLAERELYYIAGGLLADLSHSLRGRLEFRQILDGDQLLAAIHDFTPRLPWLVYRWTQAVVHLIVMRAFDRHLAAPARYLDAGHSLPRLQHKSPLPSSPRGLGEATSREGSRVASRSR